MRDYIRYYRFDALLQKQGWLMPAYVGVTAAGTIGYLSENSPTEPISVEIVGGIVLPGFQNGHSHAFQYAMAGMAEKHIPGSDDDFWTWREKMYECALALDPDQLEAIATMLYAEMLRKGYTHVAEFHYLHHDFNGKPYDMPAETGARLIAAAKSAGIKITIVPVFYELGGFGHPATNRQRRFICSSVDEYLQLLEATRSLANQYEGASAGFGVHSLRAVSAANIFRTIESGPMDLPFHIHAAEQIREVNDCITYLGQRPVEWLLNHMPLNERFNLVHCTHLTDDEVKHLAQSRANVVLCPSTEGNLGDGIFRFKDYSAHYGNWCIGTDSQINLNPLEDLRWLDYAQRLLSNRRNTFDDGATVLMNKSIPCGRKAMGIDSENFFEHGAAFDAVVFDSTAPTLFQGGREHLLPSIIYTSDSSCILGTIVNGRWVVRDGLLGNGADIKKGFDKVVKDIASQS